MLTNIFTLFIIFTWNYWFSNYGLFFKYIYIYIYIYVNVTTNLQSFLYLCLVNSGCVKHNMKFPAGNSLFQDKTLTCYHHCTISTWGQSEKSIVSWIYCIRNKKIQAPGRPPFLALHHPATLEASTYPTKSLVPAKKSHSWILSHRNFFITLACGIRVLCIATK